MNKKLALIGMLLLCSTCYAALTGSFTIGIGVAPLGHAVAKVSRLTVVLTPVPYIIVVVDRFVSLEMFAANQATDNYGIGDMSAADMQTYILGPIASGTIKTYEEGAENWLIREGGQLASWTKLEE